MATNYLEGRRRRRHLGRRRWRRERVDLHLREVENSPRVSVFGFAARQLDHDVLCHMRALTEQRAKRVRRRRRLGADHPRVCGADAVGDGVVPQSALAAVTAVVHGDVGDLGCRAEV